MTLLTTEKNETSIILQRTINPLLTMLNKKNIEGNKTKKEGKLWFKDDVNNK